MPIDERVRLGDGQLGRDEDDHVEEEVLLLAAGADPLRPAHLLELAGDRGDGVGLEDGPVGDDAHASHEHLVTDEDEVGAEKEGDHDVGRRVDVAREEEAHEHGGASRHVTPGVAGVGVEERARELRRATRLVPREAERGDERHRAHDVGDPRDPGRLGGGTQGALPRLVKHLGRSREDEERDAHGAQHLELAVSVLVIRVGRSRGQRRPDEGQAAGGDVEERVVAVRDQPERVGRVAVDELRERGRHVDREREVKHPPHGAEPLGFVPDRARRRHLGPLRVRAAA